MRLFERGVITESAGQARQSPVGVTDTEARAADRTVEALRAVPVRWIAGGTPPASPFRRLSEFEYQPRRDLPGQDLLEAGVDVLDPADVGDNTGAARGVQLEYLRDVKPRADDRADD
jgi:hypothetical protein